MKRIINLILIIILAGNLVMFHSCKEDFLEEQPPGTAAGNALASPKGVEGLLIGAYDMLTGDWNGFGSCMATDWTYGAGASDNAYKGTSASDQPDFNQVEKYQTLPTNSYMSARWRDCYNGIARANDVLNFLREAQNGSNPLSEKRAKEVRGEAKFLRAWYHFKATRIWENIPYLKTEEEMGKPTEEVSNDSPAWDEIEEDLQSAIDNLPEESPNGEPGRADKYAAMAVKAHVHLFQGEYQEAKPLLDNIINNGGFALADDYRDNYRTETENNVESLFEIQISASAEDGGVLNANQLSLTGMVFPYDTPGPTGWCFFQPSQNLFEAFQTTPGGLPILDESDRDELKSDMGIKSSEEFIPTTHPMDPRVDWTIARRGIPYKGYGVFTGNSQIRSQPNGGPYMTRKYTHDAVEPSSQGGTRNMRNFRAYRYSHVLLWRAEVAVEENDLDYARQLVNMIRNRAQNSEYVKGNVTTYVLDDQPTDEEINWEEDAANYVISTYPSDAEAFSSQSKARKAVRLEQRLEFATEGLRYFQLRRWGIVEEELNAYITDDSEFRSFLRGVSYDLEQDDYWPLPQGQLDIQPVLKQDPAYE